MKIRIATVEEKLLADLSEFPKCYMEFLKGVEDGTGINTVALEREGKQILIPVERKTESEIIAFVDRVFRWGGHKGEILHGEGMARAVGQATQCLRDDDIECAIKKITSVEGVGIFYGSAVLRMMSPEQVGAYNKTYFSRILDYSCNDWDKVSHEGMIAGFVEFCQDCERFAVDLERRGVRHPHRESGRWFVADVEAVVSLLIKNLLR